MIKIAVVDYFGKKTYKASYIKQCIICKKKQKSLTPSSLSVVCLECDEKKNKEWENKSKKLDDEIVTYQKMYDIMKNYGWVRITPSEYKELKLNKKNTTARIGFRGFFKLKLSEEDIQKNKNAYEKEF